MSSTGVTPQKRVFLKKEELENLSKDDIIEQWLLQDQYINSIELKTGDTENSELVSLRESEEKLKQQQLEATRRENILVMRLTTKEQEMQEYASQIQELKQSQVPTVAQLRAALLDPAVNLVFEQMRKEVDNLKARLEETQNELSAWKFTPDSNTGKRLMAKCRLLYKENEELGKVISSGRMAKLEGDLALQRNFSEEMKKSQTELDEFLQELDEDVDGMQSTIIFLQQQLREAKDQIAKLQNENEHLASTVNGGRRSSPEVEPMDIRHTPPPSVKIPQDLYDSSDNRASACMVDCLDRPMTPPTPTYSEPPLEVDLLKSRNNMTSPEPTMLGLRNIESRTPEPRYNSEPGTPEPSFPEPRTPEPIMNPEPRTPEPKIAEPRTPEPKTAEPCDPIPTYSKCEEPRTPPAQGSPGTPTQERSPTPPQILIAETVPEAEELTVSPASPPPENPSACPVIQEKPNLVHENGIKQGVICYGNQALVMESMHVKQEIMSPQKLDSAPLDHLVKVKVEEEEVPLDLAVKTAVNVIARSPGSKPQNNVINLSHVTTNVISRCHSEQIVSPVNWLERKDETTASKIVRTVIKSEVEESSPPQSPDPIPALSNNKRTRPDVVEQDMLEDSNSASPKRLKIDESSSHQGSTDSSVVMVARDQALAVHIVDEDTEVQVAQTLACWAVASKERLDAAAKMAEQTETSSTTTQGVLGNGELNLKIEDGNV